jgi:hypothetical protein
VSRRVRHENPETVSEPTELDPGFCSGPWTGYYTMDAGPWSGFHRMNLHLRFASGHFNGVGDDDVGAFSLKGSYELDSRRCWFIKTYDSHVVRYHGAQLGRTIAGNWVLSGPDTGDFCIWPGGEEALSSEFFVEEARAKE